MLPTRNPHTNKPIRPPIAFYAAIYALSVLVVMGVHFAIAERAAAIWA